MITLRIEPHLSTALRAGYEAAGDDAPVEIELLDRVQTALSDASAVVLPGLPVLVTLEFNRRTGCASGLLRGRQSTASRRNQRPVGRDPGVDRAAALSR